jgi:hypothetical protein
MTYHRAALLLGLTPMMKTLPLALLLTILVAHAQPSNSSSNHVWKLTSAKVQRILVLEGGRFFTRNWTDRTTGRDLQSGMPADELGVTVNGKELTGLSGGWSFVSENTGQMKDGSTELDLTLRHDDIEATKSYVTYPGSSILREWVTFKNVGSANVTVADPRFLNAASRMADLKSLDFYWMTGGENRAGSWLLNTEALQANQSRNFDSYDAFPGAKDSKFEFKMGSASYAPWFALFSRSSKQGLFMGFDYFGRWASSFAPGQDQRVTATFRLAGYHQVLNPGASITTPKAFTGLFRDDLDNAGNELLDWQYQYLWDYTRPGWFPAIRMLGWWWNGTPWKDPGNTWVGGNGDRDSAFRKVFRVADLMSEVGADVYHRDWGWWDHAGDWSGPDFKAMGEYLRKRDMGQLIYAFLYTVDPHSRLAKAHPDWVFKDTLDMSNPAVVKHLEAQLDDFAERFGPFEWRNDSVPTVPHGSDDTPLLGQDAGFRELLRNFLDRHPAYAFQGVNGGGNEVGYDYARYASSLSFSDGAVGILRNYWAALLLPPDKSSDIPDKWQPDQYDKSSWRGLLTINFDMTGDTWDRSKLEGIRQLIDIYHYLQGQGLVGRWVHVYRPYIQGDDPTMYFERLSRDGTRGIVILKHLPPGPVTVRPKGLNPEQKYVVSFQESDRRETRSGADLMKSGIRSDKTAPGELIYLNVPYHPGSKLYSKPPVSPTNVRLQAASNMGYPGIELRWSPAHDEHWVSYYEIARNGKVIDIVAKGTYYFDHSAGADLAAAYSVSAVNGGGLKSDEAAAMSATKPRPAVILDDQDSGLSFSGKWQQETNLQPAYQGTMASSDEEGASVQFTTRGSKFTWFTRLCAECGTSQISIDDNVVATVDTYSADDIFGVGIYSSPLPGPGPHRVKITVLGKHAGPRGHGTRVYVDGIKIDSGPAPG